MALDEVSQEPTEEVTEPVEAPEPQPEGNSEQAQESEPNPFWGEVEKLTGPNVYKLIQPHLAKADTEARNRISALNQSFAPWKELTEQGVTPDVVKQALGVVQQLNTSPEQVYESLRGFLEREGRLPSNAELKQEVIEDEAEEDEDPRDAELKTLKEQQESILRFFQDQQTQAQQAAMAQEADSWLDSERTRLLGKGYAEEDVKEIVRIAAASVNSSGQVPDNFDAAAAHYDALRDRIRTTPRPGQMAPRIPSGPGGTPSAGAVDPSSLSKDQRRELVAQMLQRGK